MVRLKLPVPPGFILSTEASLEYFHYKDVRNHSNPKATKGIHAALDTCNVMLSQKFVDEYTRAIHHIEKVSGLVFGGLSMASQTTFPLLLSVRASSLVSVHGMQETVLNLGINDDVVQVHFEIQEVVIIFFQIIKKLT